MIISLRGAARVRFLKGQLRFPKGQLRFLKGLSRFLKGQLRFLKGQLRYLKGLSRFLKGLSRFLKCLSRFLKGLSRFLKGLSRFLKGLSHTDGESRCGGKRRRRATAQAERQIHATNVCTRTPATQVHSNSARTVPYMAKSRDVRTNGQNGFIQRVLRLKR